ncbi:MAG: redoxin family protein [Candidatus Taylorbacteria bacterium]|nr:redoxin family protein [Candidatus Taylorbacteria bacterium]
MTSPKILISIVLVVAVVGGITYLNSQKAGRVGNDEGVSVTPRLANDGEKNQTVSPDEKIVISEKPSTVSPEDKVVVGAKPSADEKTASIQKSKKYTLAKEIRTPDGFINTDGKPITIGEFVGKKVVLIDFWTYTCINCQRTFPYLNAWYAKYKDKGFVIIGIHTPEFEFEKVYQNVLDATKRFGLKYPVVLDNDYSTWNAYQNRFWPRKYLIDIDGYVIYDHIGEGGYEETERRIQEALAERMKVLGESGEVKVPVSKVDTSALPRSGSPETYFGSARNQYFANGRQGASGVQRLSLPEAFDGNRLYLGGDWDIQSEFAENQNAGASIVFKYKAKEVYFVASAKGGVRAKIYSDGVLLSASKGEDVDSQGAALIKEDRLYKIIKNPALEEHTLKIEIESPGLRAYTFTFG